MKSNPLIEEVLKLLATIDVTEKQCAEDELRFQREAYMVGKRAISFYMHRESTALRNLMTRYFDGQLCEDCFGPAFHDNGMPCRCGDNS